MSDKELIRKLSYIKRSKNRLKIVYIIGYSFKIPSEIAQEMNIRINQINNTIRLEK